jgi:hypothetical protein
MFRALEVTRGTWSNRRRLTLWVLIGAALCVLGSVVASAYWDAATNAGGRGAASAATVNQGATPAGSATAQAVTLN